ncbi:hypothetical protein [Ideonella sp. A 288]|uniref:hypothetical protein n=1 Tax=Ideonella sp. A 288 TaxID=1962181 RepID=UPI000B4C1B9A|nr:hypothetical protein [Ideonella sp. A 288]
MDQLYRTALAGSVIAFASTVVCAQGADPGLDALDLKAAPAEATGAAPSPTRLVVEGALGAADLRFGLGHEDRQRLSIDLVHRTVLAPGWRATLSNRLDHLHPRRAGGSATLNSLREAFVSWTDGAGATILDAGRVNLRHGPAYGYNPTDFFRDNSLRAVTTADPIALRENRLGTVALRGQRLWKDGSMAVTWSPKLANSPSGEAFSLDLGSTNNRHRGLVSVNHQWSERLSGQALLYKEAGLPVQPGASLTALVSDAAVAHAEWSYAREPRLIDRALGSTAHRAAGHRLAAGLTYTTARKLSITAEWQANGLAMSQSEWDAAAASGGGAAIGRYLQEAERRLDLAARRAVMVYAVQRDAGVKNLDLTAFVRWNTADHSRISWLEARYRWPSTDLALQWQHHGGRQGTEFGSIPDRQTIQAVLAYHFR